MVWWESADVINIGCLVFLVVILVIFMLGVGWGIRVVAEFFYYEFVLGEQFSMFFVVMLGFKWGGFFV